MRLLKRASDRPPAARLIHVGPHKTGTTTIQRALDRNAAELDRLGVHYVRPRLQATRGVTAVSGILEPGAERDVRLVEWQDLVARASGQSRVVLSNEFLCEADDDGARRVVSDLGGPADTRIVVTLRPLAKILPSQWQQFVQSGTTTKFGPWLEEMLGGARSDQAQLFWRRHAHDELVARWAGVVGPDNVTVVVLDERDPSQLAGVFAELIGIPVALLAQPGSGTTNRSLTAQETEALRRFNLHLETINEGRAKAGRAPIEIEINRRLGAWERVKRRTPREDEHPIHVPPRFVGLIEQRAARLVDAIGGSGVEVVGDLRALAVVDRSEERRPNSPVDVPAGLGGLLAASLLAQIADDPSALSG